VLFEITAAGFVGVAVEPSDLLVLLSSTLGR
jgi:hypothetical protein